MIIQNDVQQINLGPGQKEHSADIRKTAVLWTSVLSHPPPPYLVILKMGETDFLGTQVINHPL
jgi:hypothetical protein